MEKFSARIRVGSTFKDFYFQSAETEADDAQFAGALEEVEAFVQSGVSAVDAFQKVPEIFRKRGFIQVLK